MNEDDLVNALIDSAREHEIEDEPMRINVEPHYNHYGNRGAADLYTALHNKGGQVSMGHVYEVKSDAALREATGANEIIRQFTKMVKYFLEDDSRKVPTYSLTYELSFLPTTRALRHVIDNESMYQEAMQTTPELESRRNPDVECFLSFRHPDDATPVRPFEENYRQRFWDDLHKASPNLDAAIGDELRAWVLE